jgi:cardiolipin synthase
VVAAHPSDVPVPDRRRPQAANADGSQPAPRVPDRRRPQDLPVDHSRDVFSVPNVITVMRFALVPLFYWFLVFTPTVGGRSDIAFALFVLCAGTDWLDGLIARRTGHVTAIGKVIDPLVDRVLIAAALIGLYSVGRVSLLLLLVLIGRDVYLLYGAWLLERHGRRLDVSLLGKTTTAILMTGFASLIWDFPVLHAPVLFIYQFLGRSHIVGGTRPLGSYIVYVGLALSLASAVQYTIQAQRAYREAVSEQAAS